MAVKKIWSIVQHSLLIPSILSHSFHFFQIVNTCTVVNTCTQITSEYSNQYNDLVLLGKQVPFFFKINYRWCPTRMNEIILLRLLFLDSMIAIYLSSHFFLVSFYLTKKNTWFFKLERFGQSHVLKEWTSFNKRLRIVLIKEPAIFH